jgi:hypothetical protein
MTQHSNNDYELIIGFFGIIIAGISAFISYKLNTDLLETIQSFVVTIILVAITGFSGKYFDINIF